MKRLLVLAAALVVLLLVLLPGAEATNRARVGCTGHHAPVIYAPAAAAHHDYGKVYYPRVVEVDRSPDYYFSVRDYYRDQLLADAIAFRILSQTGGLAPEQAEAIEKTRPSLPSRKPPPGAGRTAVNPKLKASLDTNCVKCHKPGTDRADLSDPGLVPSGLRWEAHGRINAGNMPPKPAQELPNEDVLLYYEWALEGSKAISQTRRP